MNNDVLFGIGASALTLVGAFKIIALMKLKKYGLETVAEVQEVSAKPGYVIYKFNTQNSESINKKATLFHSRIYEKEFKKYISEIKVGDQISIKYLKDNPKTSLPLSVIDNEIKTFRNFVLFGLIIAPTIVFLQIV